MQITKVTSFERKVNNYLCNYLDLCSNAVTNQQISLFPLSCTLEYTQASRSDAAAAAADAGAIHHPTHVISGTPFRCF
jgi:hypothetical protein